MEKANWILKREDVNKGYLQETREYIYKLKTDLMQKILSSQKKTTEIEVDSIRYSRQNNN
jgi:hypothetical protein